MAEPDRRAVLAAATLMMLGAGLGAGPDEVVPADGRDVLSGNGDDDPIWPRVVEGARQDSSSATGIDGSM